MFRYKNLRDLRGLITFRGLLRLTAYLALISAAVALTNTRTDVKGAETAADTAKPLVHSPKFSLSTNRTYGTGEKARVYVSYQGIESLDLRVYRVKDPFKFFKQLSDPHQMGEEDQGSVGEVASTAARKPSYLEKLRSFKNDVYFTVKDYFRSQLRREARTTFNDRYRTGEQLPLNAADYARVPLLNPDQLVGSWRQVLPKLENEYDTRMIPLGKREPGVYLIEAVNGDLRAYTIAVVTDMTIVHKTTTEGDMLIYAVDRKSGEPRDNVKVQVMRTGKVLAEGTTDRDGVLQSKIQQDTAPKKTPTPAEDRDPEEGRGSDERNDYLIMAARKDEFAISDLSPYLFAWNRDASEGGSIPGVTSYIYTDRPIYRPEQKIYFKGILRRLGEGGYEMLDARTVNVTVTDPNNAELMKKDLALSPRGAFNASVDVPANAPLGSYSIVVKLNDAEAARSYFEVAEYKKPEFKVKASTPKQFVPVGEKAKFTVDAKYFFGEPVRNADVKYYIYRSRYYHWWWDSDDDDGIGADKDDDADAGDGEEYGYGNDMVKEGAGRLDANGQLEVIFDVPQYNPKDPWDYTYRFEAQVTDSSRRMIDGKASFVGTRGAIVASASPERYVYYQNDVARLKVKTADYEGRPVPGKVTLRFVEVKYEKVEKEDNGYKYFQYKPIRTTLGSGDVTTNSQGEAEYDYKIPIVGFIDVETIVNEGGKQILSNGGYIYSTDRSNSWADYAYRDSESIKVVTDKKSYKPGETAHVLAMLPADKAHLLVTTELSKVMDVKHVYAAGRAVTIDVPIKENFAPNVYLGITYVKDGEMFEHRKSISVPARNKFLQIEVITDKKQYKPRDPASYTIVAKNSDNSPAPGVEVSLGLVDEAIYSVRPDSSGDIRRAFYGTRYSNVSTDFSSSYNFTGYSGRKEIQLAAKKRSYQLADFKNETQLVEPKIRKDFKDTAYWQPDVVTGPDGKATVKLTLPDNLTTWRATARAVSPDLKVGSKIDRVLARKDLILRLETPRFMTEGDTVTVSGIVHNYLDSEKVAQVELKVNGANLIDKAQQTFTIQKQGEQRVNWRISASQIGSATLLATAKTNSESDGIEIPLPIVPVGLKQIKGEAAVITEDNAEKTFSIDLPADTDKKARSLRIEATPSMAGSLFGALDYLTSYPYGCTEQTMSSFLPNVIVAQTLKEVKTASIRASNDLPKKVDRGLDRLYDYQHDDGGWGWWKTDKTDPFMTAYVVDGLAMAKRAGFGVNNYRYELGRTKVKSLLDSGKLEDGKPIDPESRAYLVYAYNVSGDADARYINDLFAKRNELQPYGRALLALALKARGDQARAKQAAGELGRLARITEYDVHWESKRRPMLDFTEDADIEATALSIKALAEIDPQSQVLPKAARWLVANRRNGYFWDTTKNTAFAIYGLTDYLKVSKELSPDYSFEVYLNNEQVISKHVTGADAVNGLSFVIDRKDANLGGSNQVRVVKRGSGVLYASATLEYFTEGDNLAARSTPSLSLTREYLRLKVSEVNGQPKWIVEPLSGELRSGDLIVSRLKLQGARGRYLMIEDPIPAGCEQVERVSGINLDYSDGKWTDWYSSREFRDQRTVIFDYYFDGDATFQYALRVQVPGDFKVAPARAEMMYQPTIQANSSNLKVSILDKN